LGLVAGEADTAGFDGFGEATANWAENEGGDIALRLDEEIGSFARELDTAIEVETLFLEEFGGEAEIQGAVDAPEPEFLLAALEEAEGRFELLHGTVKGRGQEENAQIPGMAGILNADSDAVFAGLVSLDAATVAISNLIGAYRQSFAHGEFLRQLEWTGSSEVAKNRPGEGCNRMSLNRTRID